MQKTLVLAALMVAMLNSLFYALALAGDVEVKPEGAIFAHYYYNVSAYPKWYEKFQENDYNGFDLSRIYFGAKVKFNEQWSAKITSDIERESDYAIKPVDEDGDGSIDTYDISKVKDAGKYLVYIKYGYLDYVPFEFLGVRFGMIDTPWISYVDKSWNYRFVQKSLTDKNKMDTSADLGIALYGKFPMKLGNYMLGAYNGEGYKAPEENEGKSFHARLDFTPLKPLEIKALENLAIGGSFKYNNIDPDAKHTYYLYTGLLSYFYQITDDMSISVGFEIATSEDVPSDEATTDEKIKGIGYSGFGEFVFYKGLGIFGRYDYFDPNTKNDKKKNIGYQDETSYIVAGLSYKPLKNVRFALDYQTTMYTAKVIDDEGKEKTKPSDSLIFFNTEFKF